MNLAAISLAALVAALLISCVSRLNIGFLSIVLAWIVGVHLADLPLADVLAGFPVGLFLTLTGITWLFAQAQVNGTLERVAARAVTLCRGQVGLIPVMFFAFTALLSSIGPGNIAATALVAPIAMAAAGRYGISPFLMAIAVANGASAGSVSPVAPTGVIVNNVIATLGLPDARWTVYLNNLVAHTVVAMGGYLLLGGWRLIRQGTQVERSGRASVPVTMVAAVPSAAPMAMPVAVSVATSPTATTATSQVAASVTASATMPGAVPGAVPVEAQPAIPAGTLAGAGRDDAPTPFTWRHGLTLAVIAALVASVLLLGANVGMAAFAGALLLAVTGAADETAAARAMPWTVIMMVTGVTVLVSLLDRTGGLELFTDLLARLATPGTLVPVTAFFTGALSIYSSTTGVVLPALLPTAPGLAERLGSTDVMAIVSAMTVGGHMVDVSPLSTLGALCLAAAPAGTDVRRMFNQVMAWGLSMTVVGALTCWIMFG
ncbi:MAG: SLC13 family permease [Vicinamibacterales bacterium]